MIQTTTINGVKLRYVVADPEQLGIQFGIGSTVKQLGDGAAAAINFSYADLETGTPIGRVIVDGKTVIEDSAKTVRRDELYCVDGKVHIGKAPDNAAWAVQGSPRLLRDGKNVVHATIQRDNTGADIWQRKARRTAAGITATGKVVLVSTVDELYLSDLAAVMLELDCVDALNGDGGGSSYLWPSDTGWGRKVGVAITVKEARKTMRIAIDAGHGPETPGKRTPDDSLREYHFNSAVARYVVEQLKLCQNVEVLTTHNDSRDVPLSERTDAANMWGANLFVSIHANASGATWGPAEGIETYVYTTRPAPAVALANAVQRQLVRLTGRRDRGVKSADFAVLRDTKMTSILIECGFMTNKQEAELLKSDAYRRKCAMAIVTGIVETYGLKRKPQPADKPDDLPRAEGRCGILYKGKRLDGYIHDGVSYAPVRALAEAFGLDVGWDGENVILTEKTP